MKEEYLIVGLLLVLIFLVFKGQNQPKEEEKKNAGPIRYWYPGYNMSDYYPFSFGGSFRRHHRFHGARHRRH